MLKIKQFVLMLILAISALTLTTVSKAEQAFTQQGKASWYGGKHHGKKTASGERYNMHSNTIAHKTLPFGTRVEITNLDNGKTTVGVVRDRGPYIHGRVADVSYKIAQEIGLIKTGVCNVKIKKLL